MAKKSSRKLQQKAAANYSIIMIILAIFAFPIMWQLLKQLLTSPVVKHTSEKSTCDNYFFNHTYHSDTDASTANTILIGVIHGSNDEEVVDCLQSLVAKGDHLLIEVPANNDEQIPCDSLHKNYQRFNGQVKCFGFDVSVDDARLTYTDLGFRANFIAEKTKIFLKDATSGNAVIEKMLDYINFAIRHYDKTASKVNSLDPNFTERNGRYFKKLAERMHGLSILEVESFLIRENNLLADQAEYYEKLSRKGPTNQSLTKKIAAHQQQLYGSGHRLFGVGGVRHFDLNLNKDLSKHIASAPEPVTLLTPKTYSYSIS